jgi:peptide chain release factor subunit 1
MTTALAGDASRRIRRLAELHADEPVVISCYINLDPAQFPTGRERDAEIDSLVHDLRTADLDGLSHDAANAVRADVDRLEDWLRTSLEADGAASVAVFACSDADVFEIVPVAQPVGPAVHVDKTAVLQPLMHSAPAESWCVFVIDRRNERVFRGNRDRMDEIARHADDVHGQHDQGGWSQARYERSVEKEVSDHVRDACDRLFHSFRRLAFDRLLLACPQEMRGAVEDKLHAYLRERLAGYLDAGLEGATAAEVADRARPLIEQDERRRESALVERLAESLGRDERAASSLGEVLRALDDKRVDVLLVAPGYAAPGAVCPRCQRMGLGGGTCPLDGAPLDEVEDIVEWAVRSAVLQSATVHELRYHEADRALGGPIAALLRY